MKEAQTNTVFNNSLKKKGFSHKIADPVGGYGIQNPFDGFTVAFDKHIYWEGKIVKGGFYSFNFNRIEDHQYNNLLQIRDQLHSICIINLAIWQSRKFFYFLLFDIELIKYLKDKNKNSFIGKELKQFVDNNLYLEVKKKEIVNIDDFLSKIISIDSYEDMVTKNGN